MAKIDAKMAKIDAKLQTLHPRIAMGDLRDRCRGYVRHLLNHGIAFDRHDDGQPAKKTAIADINRAVEDTRKKVANLWADLREFHARPRRSADIKAAARKLVEATAKAPLVAQSIDHGDPIEWPIANIAAEVVGGIELDGRKVPISNSGAAAFGGTNDALGILLWAFKDPIVAALDREIDLYADDANALSDEDRAKGEADLSSKILSVEREEEALIRMAEDREMVIPRRRDADPRAVLGLASTLPPMMEVF